MPFRTVFRPRNKLKMAGTERKDRKEKSRGENVFKFRVPRQEYGYRNEQMKGLKKMNVKRGDVFYADLSPVVGSEQGGLRPVLIIQNDVGNRFSPTVIAAAITSRLDKADLPTHIGVSAVSSVEPGTGSGLTKDSVILLEQIRTLDKRRLRERLGHMDEGIMRRVDRAISVSFGLGDRGGGAGSGPDGGYTG